VGKIAISGSPEAGYGDEPHSSQKADEWIAERLREIDYDLAHPYAQFLADHLQSRAIGTFVNMKKSNELLTACEKFIPCRLPSPPESWDRESENLIVISVRASTPRFITQSMRKWDPRGSAIATYFVNYCFFEFKKVYVDYCKEEFQGHAERPMGEVVELFERTRAAEASSEDLAIARQTIREAVTLVGSQEFAQIVLLTATGATQEQISRELGISVSTLRRRIENYRQRLERSGWSVEKGR
jgi:Homeodomain-like domain